MKKYKVIKPWPGVGLGEVCELKDYTIHFNCCHYSEKETIQMLKEGWIEEVSEIKTLEEKIGELSHFAKSKAIADVAKDHYLGLLDEAENKWRDEPELGVKYNKIFFLRKYLESEGNI